MKSKIVSIKDIAMHPRQSLSAHDYLDVCYICGKYEPARIVTVFWDDDDPGHFFVCRLRKCLRDLLIKCRERNGGTMPTTSIEPML